MHFTALTGFLFVCSITFINISSTFATKRPIIGILAQRRGCKVSEFPGGFNSIIAASYVKYVESAGARVVPIMIGRKRNYYKKILEHVNGILFPGGATSFNNKDDSDYADAGEIIYGIAKKFNDDGVYFPIWGTCLGFELLAYLAAGRNDETIEHKCRSLDEALKLEFDPSFSQSKVFKEAPAEIINILKNENVTYNHHTKCLTKKSLKNVKLEKKFRSTSYGHAEDGTKFIASFEHVDYPFYGVQFHPEKNAFEWSSNLSIPHTRNAIKVTHFFADFFVNEARKNNHSYKLVEELEKDLIYQYAPKYTSPKGSLFEQCYMFR